MRIGIVGAGVAGLTLAWLVDGVHECVVLETRQDVGGNLRSQRFIDDRGVARTVDLGVREVSLEGFTLFARLARSVGLADGDWSDRPTTHTVRRAGQERPLYRGSLTETAHSGEAERAVATFTRAAVDWAAKDLPWSVSLGEMVEPWPVSATMKTDLIYALAAAIWACDVTEAATLSARAVGTQFASDAPAGHVPTSQFLRNGMQDLAWRLAAQLTTAELRPAAALQHVRRVGERWVMTDCGGVAHQIDAIVLAVPADIAADTLKPLAGTEPVRRALSMYRYADIHQGAHLDPCYLPKDRRQWSTTNTVVDGSWASSTLHYRFDDESEAFVSQLAHQERLPRHLLARASFRTLLPFPEMFAGLAQLSEAQGQDGLYFAGHVMGHVASQEAAVASAVEVAKILAPHSPRLATLTL
ncbi:NAD(P)-binding protein [Streptomyces sp. NPDC017988]|uniref:NAD(P)-binding protein n=1 Tax=Streptomyces sp. NPDC017988 TaxID=3365025 RepID=UPI0037B89CB4